MVFYDIDFNASLNVFGAIADAVSVVVVAAFGVVCIAILCFLVGSRLGMWRLFIR